MIKDIDSRSPGKPGVFRILTDPSLWQVTRPSVGIIRSGPSPSTMTLHNLFEFWKQKQFYFSPKIFIFYFHLNHKHFSTWFLYSNVTYYVIFLLKYFWNKLLNCFDDGMSRWTLFFWLRRPTSLTDKVRDVLRARARFCARAQFTFLAYQCSLAYPLIQCTPEIYLPEAKKLFF